MKVHIIAIGGSIMHNLAIDLKNSGCTVTGSDDDIHEPSLSRLAQYQLLPKELGWFPEKITKDIDLVILGMHAMKDNPELIRAQELGLKIYSYPEYIFQSSKNKKRIVIGGSHGKTTITSMVLHVLKQNNISTDYLVGAQIAGFDTMVKITQHTPILVAEGDEYLASCIDSRPKFLIYKPHIAVISGISWDHINVFPTYDDYKSAFVEFVKSIESNGILIYNSLDKEITNIIEQSDRKDIQLLPYQYPGYQIENGRVIINHEGQLFPLRIFGKHNLQNIEAARLVCNQIGIDNNTFYKSMTDFSGAAKRLEKWIEQNDIIVYRDFAHAPSKVKATLDAVREIHRDKQIIAVFELHTYSSLNEKFWSEYKNVLLDANYKIVYFDAHTLQIKKLPSIDKNKIKEAFNDQDIIVIDNKTELLNTLKKIGITHKGLLLMSSGTFSDLSKDELLSFFTTVRN